MIVYRRMISFLVLIIKQNLIKLYFNRKLDELNIIFLFNMQYLLLFHNI